MNSQPFIRLNLKILTVALLTQMVAGCGPGQFQGPTITPSPTSTFTPVPTLTSTPTRTATPTKTPLPMPQGMIVFDSNRIGYPNGFPWGIYAISADGNGEEFLLTFSVGPGVEPQGDSYPSWSLDGKKVVFDSDRDGNSEIYAMNIDGSGLTRLTSNQLYDGQPAWSPNGQKIAYNSDRNGGTHLYVMNSDGSNPIQVASNVRGFPPAWSPDSKSIAFTSDEKAHLYIVNADGTDLHSVTEFSVFNPVWSPDGSKIAFAGKFSGNLEIYVMAPDGSAGQVLTHSPAVNIEPSWSSDGNFIAFSSDRNGNFDIFVMRANNGSGLIQLTTDLADEHTPQWSPAGVTASDLQFNGSDGPWFGEPQCMIDTDGDAKPDTTTTAFQLSDKTGYIVFPYANMRNGMEWEITIYLDEENFIAGTAPWNDGEEGNHVMTTLPFFQAGTVSAQFILEETGQEQTVECEIE